MRIFLIVLGVLVLGVTGALWTTRAPSYPDSYVLAVKTVVDQSDVAAPSDAVWVAAGVIQGVGTRGALEAQTGLPVVDFSDAVLTAGLIEPHTHPIATALLGAAVDVSGFRYDSRAEIMARLAEAAGETALTPWLVAYGWDPVRVDDLTPPTLAELDAIAPDRPMLILTQMLHEAFANTAALEAAGLPVSHGAQLRELEEVGKATAAIPAPSSAAVEYLVRQQYQAYARAGFTTIGITGAVGRHADPVGLLQKIGQDESTPLRSFVYLIDQQAGDLLDLETAESPRFGVLGTKIWIDGSPFTGEAAVREPYAESHLVLKQLGIDHGHTGPSLSDGEALQQRIVQLHKAGHQIAVHVQGERAVELVLDAFAAAQAAHPNPALKHRLEHNALITRWQIARAVDLGLSLGFFVDHVTYYGDRLAELFGAARAERYMPVANAVKAGGVVALHADHPATPLAPMQTFATATSRQSLFGGVVGADQAISRAEALGAMTQNAAEQLRIGDQVGRIAVGMRADFTLLAEDPLQVASEQLPEIAVVGTIVDGQPVDLRPLWRSQPGLLVKVLIGLLRG